MSRNHTRSIITIRDEIQSNSMQVVCLQNFDHFFNFLIQIFIGKRIMKILSDDLNFVIKITTETICMSFDRAMAWVTDQRVIERGLFVSVL